MFYKNGVCQVSISELLLLHVVITHIQGTAFNDIYAGTYYPALSIYNEATVSLAISIVHIRT